MKNLIIYNLKIIILYLIMLNCTSIYIVEFNNMNYYNFNGLEQDLAKNIKNKKTGTFIYPQFGTKISLKKGNINGIFQIIEGKDTIFYCNYIDNKPYGYYIMNYNNIHHKHFRTLPLKPKIDFGNGIGFFNSEHKKEGFWIESDEKGYYKNGLKDSLWIKQYYNTTNGYNEISEGFYKNNLKEGLWTEIFYKDNENTNYYKKIKGIYRNDKKDSIWIIEIKKEIFDKNKCNNKLIYELKDCIKDSIYLYKEIY